MDALLELWTHGLSVYEIRDAASVAVLRDEVRRRARLPAVAAEALATAASELGHNQLRHARRGLVAVQDFERDGVAGLEVIAADEGPGIPDLRQALRGDGVSSAGGLGIGLGAVTRLVDELDVETHIGHGTCIRVRKLAAATAPRPQVAILGKPCRGETVSGDFAGFRRADWGLRLAMADGLGHGPLAREPALRGVRDLLAGEELETVDRELVGTRGAVIARIDIDERHRNLDWQTLGNLGARLVGRGGARALTAGLGYAGTGRPSKILRETQALAAGDTVIVFSDGLASATGSQIPTELATGHPAFLAHHLLVTHGRNHDDQTIVVIR
jgi:anti-sigma regulatory factor (Ser/Thr protein kinase)